MAFKLGVKGVSGLRGCRRGLVGGGGGGGRGGEGACVCTLARAAGWEGFPLSHKADGADLCGCSHSPPPPAPTSIENSVIDRKQPEAELLQKSVHANHGKFRLLKEQAGTSARYQGDARWRRWLKVAGRSGGVEC